MRSSTFSWVVLGALAALRNLFLILGYLLRKTFAKVRGGYRFLSVPSNRRSASHAMLGVAIVSVVVIGFLSLGATRVGPYQAALTDSLRLMIKAPPTVADVSEELECLARNVYFEARGEPAEGKRAVAHVVMNRAASGRFPDTVCDVVYQGGERGRHKCQFSWWCDGRSDRPNNQAAWSVSQEVAHEVYWGQTPDPTDGALWYHTTKVKPIWRKALILGPQIGDHLFYVAPDDRTQLASSEDSEPE